MSGPEATDQDESEVEHVSIMEYNENAADHGRTPGERVIVGGHRRNTNVRCDEKKGFVEIAEAVAIIELHQPIDQDEVTNWCNSEAGKLVLSHWFDVTDPKDVICAGRDAEKEVVTDGGQPETDADQETKWSPAGFEAPDPELTNGVVVCAGCGEEAPVGEMGVTADNMIEDERGVIEVTRRYIHNDEECMLAVIAGDSDE